jgi:hypothetical protein
MLMRDNDGFVGVAVADVAGVVVVVVVAAAVAVATDDGYVWKMMTYVNFEKIVDVGEVVALI